MLPPELASVVKWCDWPNLTFASEVAVICAKYWISVMQNIGLVDVM